MKQNIGAHCEAAVKVNYSAYCTLDKQVFETTPYNRLQVHWSNWSPTRLCWCETPFFGGAIHPKTHLDHEFMSHFFS